MRITTKIGDTGFTKLLCGHRINKTDTYIRALGLIDELNCNMGIAKVFLRKTETAKILNKIQGKLFNMGGEIAICKKCIHKFKKYIAIEDIKFLEKESNLIEKTLPESKLFIIPGKNSASAFLHLARTIARKVEISIVELKREEKIKNPHILVYFNRLSDLLYLLARYEEKF